MCIGNRGEGVDEVLEKRGCLKVSGRKGETGDRCDAKA